VIDAKLEEIRRRLLDLTRNNRLLNHRTQGQRTLELADELPAEVYRVLVEDGRTMQFLAREEASAGVREGLRPEDAVAVEPAGGASASGNGKSIDIGAPAVSGRLLSDAQSGSLQSTGTEFAGQRVLSLPLAPMNSAAGAVAERHRDLNLQTLLSGEKLQTRLVHLAREANSALQEQGYNILYLTLGMVEWREAGAETVTSRAPLVFVPVELKRKTVNTRYTIHATDEEVLTNPCLAELCQSQFKASLPAVDPETAELDAYFAKVREAIAPLSGWRFEPQVHLGLFSFSKLLMYLDLDSRNWPDPSRLTGHPLIRQLSGADPPSANDAGEMPDPAALDQLVKPVDCFQIVDADSSQQAAILAAKRGVNMVIDGPPGTGKSQTITNIIAECIAEGRTVLFVAEKAAALEVVKRRLEQTGLADFALELHSRKASKKAVLQEIQHALERDAQAARVQEGAAADLQRARDALNSYRRELHDPWGGLGISPFVAMSRAIGLAAEPEVHCDIPEVGAWQAEQLADAVEKLQKLDRRLARVGDPAVHPWRGVGLQAVGLKDKQRIRQACQELLAAIGGQLQAAAALAWELGRAAPACARDAAEQIAAAQVLLDAPRIPAADLHDDRRNSVRPEVQAVLDAGAERQELKATWAAAFKPEAEAQDWQPVLDRRRAHGHSFLRFFRSSWRVDNARMRPLLIAGKLPAVGAQIELVASLAASAKLRRQIEQAAPMFSASFGALWQGPDSNWSALSDYARDATAIRQLILQKKVEPIAAGKIVDSEDRSTFAAALNMATAASDRLESTWREWLAAICSDEKQWLGADWRTAELSSVAARLAPLADQLESIQDWVDLRQSVRETSNGPLASFIGWALGPHGGVVHGRMSAAFTRHFYRLWVEEVFGKRESLKGFRGQDHQALIQRFAALDRQWLELTRHRLAHLLASRRPQGDLAAHRQSKLGILQAEFRKKARHMPLRRLLAQAGEVVQSIKPCFMMSPLSVAQYLSPGGLEFDLVVFDEASQVEEADAYGALARGGQLLLVGDERQLPPTDFFARSDPDEADGGHDEGNLRVGDLESILSAGIVRLGHRCGLRWHYRSRHSSLIEFSNQKFYDGQLRVFPSPHTDCTELGLAFRFVEGAVYLRGAGRYNPVEAETVAAAVVRHAIEHPGQSLGIGTLNLPQRKAIEDEIEKIRRTSTDVRIENFLAGHPDEPFFVKNLENIQGDERDVIFLSIGFGKDANGRVSLNFGALNDDGGWRRLNVLITRARRRCIVFSSIRADDIDLGGTQARGIVALKEYLYAAEHGRLKDAPVPQGDHDSEFEASVCRSLRDRGWEVHAQVGCAGFAIDLAVVDPRAPGRYLLGIECDGATYHSSPTARDRDRLRQAVLENLGWKIRRIWSTDWFQRPDASLASVLQQLEELKATVPPVEVPPNVAPPCDRAVAQEEGQASHQADEAAERPPHVAGELPPGVVTYAHRRDAPRVGNAESFLHLSSDRWAEIVGQVVAVEGPVHIDEALRVCAEIYGARVSAQPRRIFEQAVQKLIGDHSITRRGEFLWANLPGGDHSEVPVRHRGNGCPVTRAELIAPEELEAAAKLVLRQQFGLKFDAITEGVARLLGFARTGPKLKDAIGGALVRLDQRGEIHVDGSQFVTLHGDS
jgi:very-short-patch-repair endonuclease